MAVARISAALGMDRRGILVSNDDKASGRHKGRMNFSLAPPASSLSALCRLFFVLFVVLRFVLSLSRERERPTLVATALELYSATVPTARGMISLAQSSRKSSVGLLAKERAAEINSAEGDGERGKRERELRADSEPRYRGGRIPRSLSQVYVSCASRVCACARRDFTGNYELSHRR